MARSRLDVTGISRKELSLFRKYIIHDIKTNNRIIDNNFIWCMTLQMYLDICKMAVLGACNEDGHLIDPYSNGIRKFHYNNENEPDLRLMSSVDLCKRFMDGRGLFTEHFNGNNIIRKDDDFTFNFMGQKCIWDNISQFDQNNWYHEDRLDDPAWFDACNELSIGAGGHPCESLLWDHLYPVKLESNMWHFQLYIRHNLTFYDVKAFLYLRAHDIPVIIPNGIKFLTDKQREKLNEDSIYK